MAVYKIDSRKGITFYKPDWLFLDPQDVPTNCGLSVAEMNNNFYLLEGRDVVGFTLERNHIKLTLMNGTTYEINLSYLCNGESAVRYTSDGSIIITGNELSTRGSVIPWMRPLTEEEHDTGEVETFTVTNPVGAYKYGWKIPCNESIQTVLQTMLSGGVKAQHVYPTFKFTLLENGVEVNDIRNIEVGSNGQFQAKFTYDINTKDGGYYVGQWFDNNYELAKCKIDKITYDYENKHEEIIDFPNERTEIIINLNPDSDGWDEGANIIDLMFKYKDSEVIPNNSDGTPNPNNNIKWLEENKDMFNRKLRVNANYKFFYGYVSGTYNEGETVITSAEDMIAKLTEGNDNWCNFSDETNPNATTTIYNVESTDERPTIVLALPRIHNSIIKTINGLGANVPNTWTQQPTSITYKPKNTRNEIIYDIFYTNGMLYGTPYQEITFK